jgi:hypothetical protein
VDAGEGWLIFALAPAELGIHPADEAEHGRHQVYLMCEDIERAVSDLTAKGVQFTQPIQDHGWGLLAVMQIPGGGELGIYEPRHPTAAGMATQAAVASARPPRQRQRAATRGTATGRKKVAKKKAGKKKAGKKKAGKRKVGKRKVGKRKVGKKKTSRSMSTSTSKKKSKKKVNAKRTGQKRRPRSGR